MQHVYKQTCHTWFDEAIWDDYVSEAYFSSDQRYVEDLLYDGMELHW